MVQMPDHSQHSDEDLMACIRRGDHDAFACLVRRYTQMFYAAAYRTCSSVDEAEDIVQDAFLKLWKNPDMWDASRGIKFTTWFYRVISNQAVDHMRKKKLERYGGGSDALEWLPDGKPGQLEYMEEMQRYEILERAVQSLPERQKMALNLCFYEGLSNKEAADILGVGVKALESLLMRAKVALRENLGFNLMDDGQNRSIKYG